MVLFRFSGLVLFRLADRQFTASLFQLPPRWTRFVPEEAPMDDSLTECTRSGKLQVGHHRARTSGRSRGIVA